jgi:AbrB family looped-hinge helix DNA binding protein
MRELIVNKKRRATLPRELRKSIGIAPGSRLEAEQREGEIIIRPAVLNKKPTDAIWGLVTRAGERNPKSLARDAIAIRKRIRN